MKTTSVLLQRSSYDLSRDISWSEHRTKGYVIRDPANNDELLYLTSSQYNKLIRVMLSSESLIEVIATPRDTPESIARKFPGPPNKTPKRAVLKEFLFNSNPQWKISGSMIDIRGNPELFLPVYYKHLISWLNLKPSKKLTSSIWKMGKYFGKIAKTNGVSSLVARLKISTIVVLKYLGGEKVKSTQALGQRIRLRNGLPAALPLPIRNILRSKSLGYTRVTLSLLYSYKGLKAKYKNPSLGTIVAPKFEKIYTRKVELEKPGLPLNDPMFGISFEKLVFTPHEQFAQELKHERELRSLIPEFWRWVNPKKLYPSLIPNGDQIPVIMAAGPNCSISYIGSGLDALAHSNLGMRSPLNRYLNNLEFSLKDMASKGLIERPLFLHLKSFKDHMAFMVKAQLDSSFMEKIRGKIPFVNSSFTESIFKVLRFDPTPTNIENLRLGKLSFKEEAAGKVRVFAIADYWTQWVLKPLHDSMFDLLKRLPTDATFDQLGKVSKFASRGYTFIASYDLKAATDLIPAKLYLEVFRFWLDRSTQSRITESWFDLLTDRVYEALIPWKPTFFPDNKTTALVPSPNGPRPQPSFVKFKVRYTRGQPMGALSSWASLALVHHFLVFLASSRVGRYDFQDYLVLGDDIVIADQAVAASYKDVCEDWGITIGLPKSFISEKGMFQFASQDMVNDINYSPVSLKEVLAIDSTDHLFYRRKGITSLYARIEFVNRLLWKGFIDDNNPLNLVRAIYAPNDWKILSRSLTRGVIPPSLTPALLLLLTSPERVRSKSINIDQVMALIRGDVPGLFNKRRYDVADKLMFVHDLHESLDSVVQDTYKRVISTFKSLGRSYLSSSHMAMLHSQAMLSRSMRGLTRIKELHKAWQDILVNAYAMTGSVVINEYLLDSGLLVEELSLANLQTFGDLISEMQSISIDIELVNRTLNPKSISELRRVKTFISLNPLWREGKVMPRSGSLLK